MISAHWDTSTPMVSTVEAPQTIHDFYGFPEQLYQMRYPAPGAPDLAQRTVELLRMANIPGHLDSTRGLDHGAWVPLMLMYPKADIPVTQLSIQTPLGPRHHYKLGEALAPLRDEGVLIVGSGAATHNLREFRHQGIDTPAYSWVTEFSEWVANRIEEKNIESVFEYRTGAPHGVRNHPTEDHFVPLFAALGAVGARAGVKRISSGSTYGILAMDHYLFS